MSTKWPQGEITPNIPASVLGGNNISGVYTLDQLNRLNADFGPQMQKSLRFRSSASAYLNRTPSVAGNRTTWTWSGWVKRGQLGLSTRQALFGSASGTSDSTWLEFGFNLSSSVADAFYVTTYNTVATSTAVYRDPSSWYHVVVSFDTTQATASNRLKVYINGSQISMSSSFTPTQNATYGVNAAQIHTIASESYGGTVSNYFDGYMAEVNFIDGQALTPSSFGKYNATTGVWQPIFYAGTYGTNGFRLTFANNASTTTLGYDSSPNGNNWTTNNISLTAGSTYDSMLDVPTNWVAGDPVQARGNYAVLSPLITGNVIAPSSGNLDSSLSSGVNAYFCTVGTMAVASGKWYWECSITARDSGAGQWVQFGIISRTTTYTNNALGFSGNMSNGYAYFNDGYKAGQGSNSAYAATFTTSDVIGVALDLGAGTLTFYKNGTSQGQAFSGITSAESWLPIIQIYRSTGTTNSAWINFGQRPFSYTPPSGFKSLCTQNLPAPAIYNGANHMAATTYTGTGSSLSISNSVNSASFQPDLVWIKSRSAATNNKLTDSVRGVTKGLISNTDGAETTDSQGVTAFGSSGFTVGTDTTYNNLSATYVGWQWKAGGTAVSNTSGTITSSVSANTTAGFSVVTYTGTGANATVGHGLGVAPSMVIIKNKSDTAGRDWQVYHISLASAANSIQLNTTSAQGSNPTQFNSTAPTSSVFSIGTAIATNGSTNTFVAYCFAAIAGYSAFGSYTGNGSADGPFVYCGFRPRWLLIKDATSANNWQLLDTSRDTYNVAPDILQPNLSNAESAFGTGGYDFLSNGFKVRTSSTSTNTSGYTIIYAAFAENPFQNSLAR